MSLPRWKVDTGPAWRKNWLTPKSTRIPAAVLAVAIASCIASASAGSSAAPTRYLVFAARLPHYLPLVEIIGADGRVERVVERDSGYAAWPDARWSPDGTMIAWTAKAGVYVERSDGTGRRRVVDAGRCTTVCAPLTFAWSPDARQLLVGGTGQRTNGLVRISLPGGGARNLVVPRLYVEYQVLGWSPDNRLVAYTRDSGNPGTASCCRRDLYVARPDGSHRRRLFRVAETIHDFPRGSWSPDSKSIAFVTDGRDPHDPSFAVVDVRSGGVRRIGGVSSFGEPPVWSPDSKRLAGAIASGKLVTVSASGGDVHSLGTSAEPGPLSWSPAGALTVVQGVRSNEVLESPDGVQPLRFLFRLPKGVAALTVDRRP